MSNVDWSKVLIRCSCLGKIMTDSKGSVFTDKMAEELEYLESRPNPTEKQKTRISELIYKRDSTPKLSDTATSYLREVYQYYKYGKESVGGSRRSVYTIKGNSVEHESIMIISRYHDFPFDKNQQRFNNDYFTGEPDIIWPERLKTLDAKSVWDMESLLSHVPDYLNQEKEIYDKDYWWQGQGYMDLTNSQEHELLYVLVNMPEEIINGERMRIYKTMNPVTDESPEYKKAIEKLEFNMTFDEIPIKERIVRFVFKRDDEAIQKAYKRIEMCREWLSEFEKIHTSLHG